MKPTILLRIASGIMFLHTVGHTMGTLGWKDTTDPTKKGVIDQMLAHKFPFMGVDKSLADHMEGYGFAAIFSLALVTVLLWVFSNHHSKSPALVRSGLLMICITLIGQAVVEWIYFFPLAAGFSFVAGVLAGVAAVQAKNIEA